MKMSAWSLACQQSVFQRYKSEKKHLWEFYPQDGGESSWHWNYVTVALCIASSTFHTEPKCAENYRINNTVHLLFFKTASRISVISNHDSSRVLFDEIASTHFIWEKYFSTENGAGPVNRHCASCIGTLSFAIHSYHSPGSVWNSPTVLVTLCDTPTNVMLHITLFLDAACTLLTSLCTVPD